MAQTAIQGGSWSISTPNARGSFNTNDLVSDGVYTLNLNLAKQDTGSLVLYVSFDDNSKGQNYTVTSETQVINVPKKTGTIQGAIQSVSEPVSYFYFQLFANS